MNTMADGAAQRLVAQIGEALFGQPGLDLMELAEKVKASRDAQGDVRAQFEAYRGGDFDRDAQGYYVNYRTAQDWAMWQAAAQPSPAGQGDVRRQWLEIRGLAAGIVKNLKAFAESPHKSAWCGALDDSLSFAETIEKDADAAYTAAFAARQPVGKEPVANGKLVAWWNGITPGYDGQGVPSIRWGADAENSGHDIPLYDGYNPIHYQQPAQAVDLERFRPAVMTALGLSSPYGLEREALNELLDLIERKAPTNG